MDEKRKTYVCKICKSQFLNLKSYYNHLRIHRHVNNCNYACPIPGCFRNFTKFSSFKAHISRSHKKREISSCPKKYFLDCAIQTCQQKCSSFTNMVAHLQKHIKNKENVKCPVINCNSEFHNRSSFSAHLSRKHPTLKMKPFKESHSPENSFLELDEPSQDEPSHDEPSNELAKNENTESMGNSLALFCLKLLSKFHLSQSVLDLIMSEILNLNELTMCSVRETVKKKLVNFNVDESLKDSILESFVPNNPVSSDINCMKNNYSRKNIFKNNFNYLEPVSIPLGRNELNKECFFHYVPIIENLKILLKNDSVRLQIENPLKNEQNDLFTDYSDGSLFKQNNLIHDKKFIKIFLYQDSFEVVNPLGSARKKHKILAVYYTIGNIHPWNRANTDCIQLVLLCKQKNFDYFGQELVFGQLVNDLKILEKGIDFEGQLIKGSIFSIIGDNLGSHTIGGFVENFSTSKYHCRYCLVETETMFSGDFYFTLNEERTVANYDQAVTQLKDGNLFEFKGIKFDSIFNDLQYFHVCQPGLPPCLGHDILEGVVSFDVFLFVKTLIKDSILTLDFLNKRISTFQYGFSENNDKPVQLNIKSNKLSGHAVQNWNFLRFFPLIFYDLKDKDHVCFKLIVLLHEIVELVCAPKITFAQICYLQNLIEEYLELRLKTFQSVPLRAKHHFMLHYPDLIRKFGPLIRLWAMRFESKHSYFKKCIRNSQNFINVTKTLSERHQFYQSYLQTGNLFQNLKFDVAIPFYLSSYEKEIQEAVLTNLKEKHSDCYASDRVTFRGIKYKKDAVVVVSRKENKLLFGKIMLILNHRLNVYFVMKIFIAFHSSKTNLFVKEKELYVKCVEISELLDYYPLTEYTNENQCLIVLKHGVIDNFQ